MLRFGCTLLALTFIVGLVGCGEAGPTLFPVTGTVTLDGKPVEGATVVFNYDGEGIARKPSGTTDENGVYKLLYPLKDGEDPSEGAPEGEYWVTITKVEGGETDEAESDEINEADMAKMMQGMADNAVEQKSLIPQTYGTRQGAFTKIKVEAKEDGNTVDLKMESKKK